MELLLGSFLILYGVFSFIILIIMLERIKNYGVKSLKFFHYLIIFFTSPIFLPFGLIVLIFNVFMKVIDKLEEKKITNIVENKKGEK